MSGFTLVEANEYFATTVSKAKGAQQRMVCAAVAAFMRGAPVKPVRAAMGEVISWQNKAVTMAENFAKLELGECEQLSIAKAVDHVVEAFNTAHKAAGTINAMYSRLTGDFTAKEANAVKGVETVAASLTIHADKFDKRGKALVEVEHDAGPRLLKGAREARNTAEAISEGLSQISLDNREQDNLAAMVSLQARGDAEHGLAEAIAEAMVSDKPEPEQVEPEQVEPEQAAPVDPIATICGQMVNLGKSAETIARFEAALAECRANFAADAAAAAVATDNDAAAENRKRTGTDG